MIYAIRAKETNYIKFGKAINPARRLATMQCGSPLELVLEATVDWPDKEEMDIHVFLTVKGDHHMGEWFKESANTAAIIGAMRSRVHWRDVIRKLAPTRLRHHLQIANGPTTGND